MSKSKTVVRADLRSTRELRAAFHGVVCRYGLLAGDRPARGHPVSVTHAHALMCLLDFEKAGEVPCQSSLVEVLGIDKSNVSRVCTRMLEAGHIRERPAPYDGRVLEIHLTRRGRRLAHDVDLSSQGQFGRLTSRLPATRVDTIIRALQTLEQAILDL